MKFAKKIPFTDKARGDELVQQGWRKLREPSNQFITILISFPFMLINGAICLRLYLYLNPSIAFLCLLNAMGGCVDLLNMFFIGIQVPKGGIIINNGHETYYK